MFIYFLVARFVVKRIMGVSSLRERKLSDGTRIDIDSRGRLRGGQDRRERDLRCCGPIDIRVSC
ncbi:hypothetical protein OESDEN_17234 [Oesophagostomum dentatum]|uniref:Uncharacterized protein n=1 Tax=Oesophagostomum dentatum TaxID=61180 RepID=A0A0B1SIP1_OESDE|nr:hypothetical protein OESDEN_17234 [Oesophagostomum dentatum]